MLGVNLYKFHGLPGMLHLIQLHRSIIVCVQLHWSHTYTWKSSNIWTHAFGGLACRFDKRITDFAEKKFHRDGIDVKLGSMVVKVSDKEISTKVRGNGGEITAIPYGMVVWSTGIGTHPVIRSFMQQIGQVCYWLIKTDLLLFQSLIFHDPLVIFRPKWTLLIQCINWKTHLLLWTQTNRRALATDEWLRVEGCNSIYALGDCATINQRKVMVLFSLLFCYICVHGIPCFVTSVLHLLFFYQLLSI